MASSRTVELQAGEVKTVWFGVGGSVSGPAQARAELRKALDNPRQPSARSWVPASA